MHPTQVLKLVWHAGFGNTQHRYEARHRLLAGVAHRLGFRLYNKNLAWLEDAHYKEVWHRFPEAKKYIHERKFNLYHIARSQRNIPGDIAECGVYTGGTSHLMLCATEGTDKQLFGFDSFEGLSAPEEVDRPARARTFAWHTHELSVSKERAERNLQQHGHRVHLFESWIPEKLDQVADRNFCLVHLDVDLYQPTEAALSFFYPRTNPGGMIVCDDYGSEACPGARQAMDEWAAQHGEHVIHLTTGQGLIIKASGHSTNESASPDTL